jgi:putative ABC transport system permease protein
MGRKALAAAFDMDGAFNDISLSLLSGSNEKQVTSEIDRLLERYGGLGAYGRTEQVSNPFISDEIAQNRVSGIVVPSIFLGVAAFLINMVLSRLVHTQREQIAVLKAFGYRGWDLSAHYTKLAVAASLAGMATGTVVGIWWGGKIGEIYGQFYRFPLIRFEPRPDVVGLAIFVSGGAAVLGAIGAARKAGRLPPAEAMQPEPPASFRRGVVERIGLAHLLSPGARIIARNLERGWVRAGLSILGIALAVAILVVGHYFEDAIRVMADSQFRHAQRDDVTIVFNDPQPGRARYEVAHLPGVLLSEPFRTVPARLRSGHRTRRVGLFGINSGGQLRRLVDKDLRIVHIPDDGIVLTAKLGEILGVNAGDEITVEILEGERPVRRVIVAGLVDELIGMGAYLDIRALNRLMREDNTISGAFLRIDSSVSPELYSVLKSVPSIGGVSFRKAALASFEDTPARSIGIFTAVLIAFAGAIAFAMVYNAARISLSERGRELASLRVLGFTRPEVTSMLLGEQIILVLLAIPSGLAIGYWICHLITLAYQWELFRLPLVLGRETYAFAIMVIAISAIISALVVRRRIYRLDLIAVLKTRE